MIGQNNPDWQYTYYKHVIEEEDSSWMRFFLLVRVTYDVEGS